MTSLLLCVHSGSVPAALSPVTLLPCYQALGCELGVFELWAQWSQPRSSCTAAAGTGRCLCTGLPFPQIGLHCSGSELSHSSPLSALKPSTLLWHKLEREKLLAAICTSGTLNSRLTFMGDQLADSQLFSQQIFLLILMFQTGSSPLYHNPLCQQEPHLPSAALNHRSSSFGLLWE